jgi:hypothetical protein
MATTASVSASTTSIEMPLPQGVDFERLPVVQAPTCKYGDNGKWLAQPRTNWAPIAESVVRSWHPGEGYAPDSCAYLVRTLCAPDLDGQPGDEVIAEIRYRVPRLTIGELPSERLSCASKKRVEKGVLVALSPPNSERAEWTFVASLGHTITGPEVESGYSLAINHFVQLPRGGRGVFTHAINPGFSDEFELVLGLERGSWSFRTLASRTVPPERRRQHE